MAEILIIDDDKDFNQILRKINIQLGHSVTCVFSLTQGMEKVLSGSYDVVFLDVRLPDGSGLDAIADIHASASQPEVIILTAFGDRDGAEIAIKNGAWNYLQKPSFISDIKLSLIRALQFREQKTQKSLFSLKRDEIIGNSPKMQEILDLIARAASSDANVLVTGETGTGKELFAETIHKNSSRAQKNFVVVDCASLPDTLIESILFGYEKGAFTGAERATEGFIEQAEGGTLFLDEVGELSPVSQKTFLRVLQERQFFPVGSKKEKRINFRLIAATNRNIEQMVETGEFRKDFFFRINSFTLELPPLRERKEDIKELIIHYVKKFCEMYGMEIKGISPDFFEAMMLYDWPGNVREFVNTMERVITIARHESILFPYHLPSFFRIKIAQSSFSETKPSQSSLRPEDHIESVELESFPTFEKFSESCSQKYFRRLMTMVDGQRNEAYRIAGLSRSKLYRILKDYNL
ncbi:sigma-54 dependent transcriptional regulator [bacterium]|nr:sigma-54 dependent transcriptional regulator [bacterium]